MTFFHYTNKVKVTETYSIAVRVRVNKDSGFRTRKFKKHLALNKDFKTQSSVIHLLGNDGLPLD